MPVTVMVRVVVSNVASQPMFAVFSHVACVETSLEPSHNVATDVTLPLTRPLDEE